jgi:DNA polymerase I-like protein with 3'-5' exonuclease and polymerase domains
MGCRRLPALNMHDAMFLMFLRDPHSRNLQLKPLAERWLNWPPEERDAVDEWVKTHKKELLELFFTKPFRPGAYIGYAPGDLVEPYACGDTDRTLALFKDAWSYVVNNGMLGAYQREQQVMPIFLDNERKGIRVDMLALRRDVSAYRTFAGASDQWLRKRLKAPDLSLDNDRDVAAAFAKAGIVRDEDWTLTKEGHRSVSKVNLTPDMFQDPRVAAAFGYRNRLMTCLKMFMEPWLEQATRRGDGYISTNWNQIRSERGGTRTGRPSTSDPNFLNISKSWDNNDDGYAHPKHLKVDPLPLVRRYLLADEGEQWLHRDYNGQELRILAHYEDGPLMQAYREDPWLDVHQHVADLIENKTGKSFTRKNVKIANFRIIYGGGAPATAAGIGCSLSEAKELLEAHGAALPSIKGRGGLTEQIKAMSKRGEPIVTWGGREYYAEPPGFSKKHGRVMDFDYKLLNYECQGSAADITKQAMINYSNHPKRKGRFLAQVYDEMNASSGPNPKAEMAVLRESMEVISEQLDVPLLSEGKWGPSWGEQKKFEEGASKYERTLELCGSS